MSERKPEDLYPGTKPEDLPRFLTKAIEYWSNNDQSLLPDLWQIMTLHRELFEGYLKDGVPGELKVKANFVQTEKGFVHFSSPAHVKEDYQKLFEKAQELKAKLNPQPVPDPDPSNPEHWPRDDDHEAWIRRAHYVAYFHAHLIHIHPFEDGNGRVTRLIAWEQARRLFRMVSQEGYDWQVVDAKDNPLFLYRDTDGCAKKAYQNAMLNFDYKNPNYFNLMRYFMFQPEVPIVPYYQPEPSFRLTLHPGQVRPNGAPGLPRPPSTESSK